MKSGELRDAMVARVQNAHQSWPSFDAMPEKAAGPGDVLAVVAKSSGDAYVKALYEVCAIGDPIGRDGNRIVGKRL